MAGLTDELISTLETELGIYEGLIPLAEKKSSVIIENDVKALASITDEEQLVVEKLKMLEKKREGIMKNMCIVLNNKSGMMKLEELIGILANQPEARNSLIGLKKRLRETLDRLKMLNSRNEKLIGQSLEMSEFHLNMIRSARGYIGNNYTRNAGQFDMSVMQTGTFDMKN